MSKRYRGVTAAKARGHAGKWQAQVRMWPPGQGPRGVAVWGGRFDNPEDAARVADAMAIYLKGPDAELNFDGRPPVGITWQEVREFLEERGARLDGAWVENPQIYCKTVLY